MVIGGGIRGHETLLELFERVVNLVRQHAPDGVQRWSHSCLRLVRFSTLPRARLRLFAAVAMDQVYGHFAPRLGP